MKPGDRFTFDKEVGEDQPRRYGEASGDMNPIHTDEEFARSVGFDTVILQGLCTMSFVHQALAEWAGGDPLAVRRLEVRFERPVYPGDRLTVEGEVESVDDGKGDGLAELAVRVVNQDGEEVLGDATAEVGIAGPDTEKAT